MCTSFGSQALPPIYLYKCYEKMFVGGCTELMLAIIPYLVSLLFAVMHQYSEWKDDSQNGPIHCNCR